MAQNRIKGLREKLSNKTYGSFTPFGTDGFLVDMMSGLQLEEELKVGGDHETEISKDANDNTIVKEKYTTNGVQKYSTETIISKDKETDIVTIDIKLFEGLEGQETLIKEKEISIIHDENDNYFIKEKLKEA